MAERLGDKVTALRGVGHLRAIELPGPVGDVIAACREQGVLVIQAGANNLRLAPALVITQEEFEPGLSVLEAAIAAG